MNLFKNQFIQALGVAAFIYLLLQAFGWGMEGILSIIQSFISWYRFTGSKWIEEISIAAGLSYLLFASVINSK